MHVLSIPARREVNIPHFEVLNALFKYPRSSKVLAKDGASERDDPDVQFLVQKVVSEIRDRKLRFCVCPRAQRSSQCVHQIHPSKKR